jgi:chromosome partitioning protein
MTDLLTTEEVAARLRVDRKTVQRWIQSGRLEGHRVGKSYRVAESAVAALLRRSAMNPGPEIGVRQVVTAVANQKGGVGKTTTTLNLGIALARRGRRVLLVDMDPQGGLTASAGLPADLMPSIYDVLLDPKLEPQTAIHQAPAGIDLMPANLDLSAAEVHLMSAISRETVARQMLSRLGALYDHVLIDCPPSLGLLTINALVAANRVLIPVQCSYLSWRGLSLLMETIETIRARVNPDLSVLGILPTLYDGRTIHAQETLEAARHLYPGKVLGTPIRYTVRAQEAAKEGRSLLEYDASSEAAKAYVQLAAEVDHVA